MIEEDNPFLAIVFCNKREGAVRLSYELTAAGLNIAEMHGDLTQGRRTQILRDFAKAKTQILVATDIAARGIDIEGITHVYNYDVPRDVDYIYPSYWPYWSCGQFRCSCYICHTTG